jgi:RNaseH domain of pPIWI_RE/pPIWI_RE module N-terminal domain/MID domain of pPIWI_RE
MTTASMTEFEPEDWDDTESEVEELVPTDVMPENLYLSLGNPKRVNDRPIAMAFTMPDNLPPIIISGITLAWNRSAIAAFVEIKKAIQPKNLPYASLRGLFEVGLTQIDRLDPSLGLRYPSNYGEPKPFAYLTDIDRGSVIKILRPLLDNWMTHYLKPFASKEDVSEELLERLDDLWNRNELLTISPFQSQVLPWSWDRETGTTKVKDQNAFHSLVDYAARSIAGQEIFKNLGSVKRIISGSGSLSSGSAQLITEPISIADLGTFSLVISLEVVTFSSLHQPLLKVDVSKRRWLDRLDDPKYASSNISGYVISNDYSDRAFSFTVQCRQDNGKNWGWETDNDFTAIREQLHLPIQSSSVREIVSGQANTDACQFLLTYKNGLNKGARKHQIDVGVPEIDKLEAFEAIAKLLDPVGLKPFDGYVPIASSHARDDAGSRMINLPTLLGAMLESIDTDCATFTPRYLESFDDSQLNNLLNLHFSLPLEKIRAGRKALHFNTKSKNQTDELATLIQSNRSALRHLYPNEQLLLVVFYQPDLQTEVKLLQGIIHLLYGDAIEVLTNRLPDNTHGSRDTLTGKELKSKARSQKRIEAWQPITKQLEAKQQKKFCLVIAREFYPDSMQPNEFKHDDRINKPSTRQALAAMAGSCVQFILPFDLFKLDDFFHRAQSALKDLLFAHSGRIDRVKEKVDKYLQDIPIENRPKEIIGITIVRKQKGRSRGLIENTFLPIAIRLNVETGNCEMCCAYERANQLEISPWNSFADAIKSIAQISPVKLADKDKKEVQKTRFMEFVRQIISNSVENNAQPLVLIDSSNCAQLWGWLRDTDMNANQINMGSQYQWMQQEWAGARIVRIRQDLAPGMIEKTERQFLKTTLTDTRSQTQTKGLTPDYIIPSASSSSKLFRLTATNQTGCVTYLSTGKTRHQERRGQSCYRATEFKAEIKDPNHPNKKLRNAADLKIYQIVEQSAFIDQWPTPNPLEIVVTLRQPNDNPDRLAALVESLRYGFGHYSDWMSLPAPLFFERVVRDYISDFAIEEDTDDDI